MDTHTQKRSNDLKALYAVLDGVIGKLEKDGRILRKSKSLSIEARKAGNDLFTKEGHDSHIHKDILSQYSKSIAFAPIDTEELILGYSDRSVLLLHIHRYEDALVDIDRALKLTKDDACRTKLQASKEKCLELINIKNLEESAKISNLNEGQANLATKLMNFQPSDVLPCASDYVSLAYDDTFGRHLVAARDIHPGEILIVEESYVCCPKKSLMYVVCSHCLQIAWNGIPCDDCAFAIYCSETCKNEALRMYHDVECPMLKYMDYVADKMCDRMAAVRLLITAVRKEGFECIINEVQKKTEETDGLQSLLTDGVLCNDKFKSYYNLLSHAKDVKDGNEDDDDDFNESTMVYLLAQCTDFLNIELNSTSHVLAKPHILFIIKDIFTKLRHILDVNGFWYQAPLDCDCQTVDECKETCNSSRGVCLTSICSLLNHSCTPNVSRIYVPKRKIIVFANSPIKKGEQLYDSYGPTYTEDVEFRQSILERGFHFTCKCVACKNNFQMTEVSGATKEDLKKIMSEYHECFSDTMEKSFFKNPVNECEFSEEFLEHIKKISELFYKHLNFYAAFGYNVKCRSYIEILLLKLYGEKSVIPNDC